MSKISWLITDNNITVNYEGQTHIVPREDKLADKIIEVIKQGDLEKVKVLVNTAKMIDQYSDGNFVVKDGKVFVNGIEAPAYLANKIVRFTKEQLPYQPLIKFAENLQKNPSFRAVNELFQFLEKNDHPITDNGCFIAYKKVRSDFMDAYSGTMDNSVGNIVSIPRNQVDEDPNRTCSTGIHCANWDYAKNKYSAGEGSIMLELEVNPADVVAVPIDYNQSKMRVCAYKVLGVVDQENSDSFRKTIVDPAQEPVAIDCDNHCHCDCDEPSNCGESRSEDDCELCGEDCSCLTCGSPTCEDGGLCDSGNCFNCCCGCDCDCD